VTTLDSHDKREVVAAIADLGTRYQPPPRWEARVWARVLRSELPTPPRTSWLRYLVPAVAVVVVIGVSGVLGAALWRTHRELGLVQTAVEDERDEVEQLRRDLVEARTEARRARVENARLHELASLRSLECADADADVGVGMDMGERPRNQLRRKSPQRTKLRPSVGVGCDAYDPLCGL